MPPSKDSRTTSTAAGLFVVPLVTVPLICAANKWPEANETKARATMLFQSLISRRWLTTTLAGTGDDLKLSELILSIADFDHDDANGIRGVESSSAMHAQGV